MPKRKKSSSSERTSDTRRQTRSALQETRLCAHCHRPFQNRRKWQQRGLWPDIRFCSERCRRAARATAR